MLCKKDPRIQGIQDSSEADRRELKTSSLHPDTLTFHQTRLHIMNAKYTSGENLDGFVKSSNSRRARFEIMRRTYCTLIDSKLKHNTAFGRFTKSSLEIALFFAVYTPAIRLPIHLQFFGGFNTLFPTIAKILVVKRYPN